MEHRVNLRCTRDEAIALRTALHIATRLCALLPHGYGNRNWSEQFDKLHADMARGEVDILPGAPAFSDNIIAVIREHGEHPDDRLLRELLGGLAGGPFDLIASRPSGGKSYLAQVLAMEHARTPPPFKLGQTVTGRIHVPGPALPDNLPKRKLPDVLMDDQSARHVALVPTPPKKRWIVQFLRKHSTPHGWVWLGSDNGGGYGSGFYQSRNEAYREMRKRIKGTGFPQDYYRVVPEGTADGPEKDRGFYTVEFFAKYGRPSELGWRTSSIHGLSGTFPTAEGAGNAINERITAIGEKFRCRYRVKWHQSKA